VGLGLSADDPLEDILQPGERLDVVELGGVDQAGDDRPMPGSAVRAGEQAVFPAQGNRPDASLDGVGVELDAAVVEEQAEPVDRAPWRGVAGVDRRDVRRGQVGQAAKDGRLTAALSLSGAMVSRVMYRVR
jgi:hypothetical protein